MTEVEPTRLTVLQHEPDWLSLEPTPGDLTALDVEALAGADQWVALAAVARHGDANGWGLQALRQLAVHGDVPAAFTWLWALLRDTTEPAAWSVLQQLPAGTRLPAALAEAVIDEFTSDPAPDHHRIAARASLLMRLDPEDPVTVRLLRALVCHTAFTDARAQVVSDQVVRLLSASRDPRLRAELLAAAEQFTDSDAQRHAEVVGALTLPLFDAEVATVLATVRALAAQLTVPTYMTAGLWAAVRRLLALLPSARLIEILGEDWLSLPGHPEHLFLEAFANHLEPATIEELLRSQLPEAVIDALLAHLPELPDPHAQDLLELAHRILPQQRLIAVRQHYRSAADASVPPGSPGTAERQRALNALRRFALATPPSHNLLLDDSAALGMWSAALRAGEVQQISPGALDDVQRRRVGAALGLLLRRNGFTFDFTPDQVHDDVAAVVTAASDDAQRAEVLTGLVAVAPSLLPDSVLRAALDAGPASTAVVAQAAAPQIAAIYTATPDRWGAERALDVLAAIDRAAATTLAVPALAGALDWRALEAADVLDHAAAVLARHPDLLQAALTSAVTSLNAAPTAQASPARIRALVEAVLAAPVLAARLGEPAPLIEVLVNCAHRELHDTAAQWLAICAPTPAVVALTAQADQASARPPSRYAPARAAQASTLCARATDRDQPDEQRLRALHLAAIADPAQAHAAALAVLPGAARSLRRGAAQVMVDTPAAAEDTPLLERLIEEEDDAETLRLLEQARRRLTSGTLGEALANALDLVGAQDSFGPLDVGVCLPDERCHERFRERVDQARRARHDTPENRVNALVLLADQAADQAIAAHWASGSPKQQAKAEQILDNARTRPESGVLANTDQQLRQELLWIASWAGLRDLRTGHPAPLGSTTPRPVDEADAAAALPLTRRVLEGWVETMYTAADQVLPPAGS